MVGTSYGGDGLTNFALPNLSGRSTIGTGQGPGLADYNVGDQVGIGANTLTVANMPAHGHSLPGGGTTGLTGGNAPVDNMQPSLAMTYMIAESGFYPPQVGNVGLTFIGQVSQFAGNFAPGGWLPADGRLLSIANSGALYSLIGTTYGGDGVQTFGLPDLRGRAIVGAGSGPGLDTIVLGQQFGGAETLLSLSQLPAHDHSLPGTDRTGLTGGSQPFTNYQPSLALNYIISLQGVYPSRNGNGILPDEDPFLGEVTAFAGTFAPDGWAIANGGLLRINQNQALFSLLGTTYGGDGQTNFALPDLRGRSIIGSGSGFELGARLGQANTRLTVFNLPAHAHDVAVVPEPASWALMISGFGLVGAAARRRRTAIAA